MSSNQNIEDLFKSNLNNLNVEPTSKVWEGVNSNLWYSNIQNLFYNYTVQPTSNAWRKIALRLWFRDFIVFSPKTFNVYYLTTILFISSTILLSYYNNTSFIKSQKSINVSDDSNKLSESTLIHSLINGNYNNTNNEEKNKEDLIVSALNNNIQNRKPIKILLNEGNNENINTSIHEPILINEELLSEFLLRDNFSLIKMISHYDTLKPEFISETTFNNRSENEYYKKYWHLSAEAFIMPLFGNSQYKTHNNELKSFNNNYGGSVSTLTLSGGILIQAKHLNFSFQTGLLYSQLTDKPDYKFLSSKYHTSMVTQIIPDYNYNYFEEEILNLDSLLLTGDSVWIKIIDSTLITTYDTITKPQTIQTNTIDHKRTLNKFTYIEIPLIAGYTFRQGQLNFTLRGGVIAGILTTVSGYLPSPYSEVGTIDIKRNTTRKIMLSGIASIEAAYDATKHISFIAAPIYRFNLFSLFNKDNIVNQRFNNYGVKLGIRYNLN
jgi:hypothetical protein